MAQDSKKEAAPKPPQVRITFEDTKIAYASQAILQGTAEELFINFSAGVTAGPKEGQLEMPVHTRIVMSYYGAKRLLHSLHQVLAQYEKNFGPVPEDRLSKKNEPMTTAGFPKITGE